MVSFALIGPRLLRLRPMGGGLLAPPFAWWLGCLSGLLLLDESGGLAGFLWGICRDMILGELDLVSIEGG